MINTKKYIENYLKISDKRSDVIPLVLNGPQQKLYSVVKEQYSSGKPQRVIILKARQMGFSTVTEAVLFKRAATGKNYNCGIVAHKDDATTNLFNMSKRYYEHLPEPIRPQVKASNAKELIFADIGSGIKCMTAGGDGIGRSDTYNALHISEYAFWKGDKKKTLGGLMQAVPNTPQSLVVIESTANGYDDFKDMWDKAVAGENDFTPVFCAWWEMDEYRVKYNGFNLTIEERELKEQYNLDDEQIAWRRWCIANNCGGDERMFRQEYPANPHEAFIATGDSVFDTEIVISRLESIPAPVGIGQFVYEYDGKTITNIRWKDEERGFIKIYSAPKKGNPYVLGGDTAGEGSDYFTGHVLDNTTGEQVAVLRHQFDEDLYAIQMYCLGMHYNTALVGIESNFSTHPIRELERLNYPYQYTRERVDTYSGKREKRHGFKTTTATRPVIISELVKVVRESAGLVNDKETLNEMLTFVRNEQGKPEALQGKHDDCVMGLAIAHEIRGQQSYTVRGERKPTRYQSGINDLLKYGG